ncbi:MAG TPA: DUF2304 domain-containing protein [Bryobacteraceae bacterium]|nr:DUF2304 domain-containing protein [Bryobacteraceae bacterium]
MDRLLSITAGLSILLIVVVLFNIRRAHIRVEYSVSWLGAAVAMLGLSQSPWTLYRLGHLMGIENPALCLLLLLLALLLMVFFRFSVIISDLKDSNIALTQKVGILEYKLNALHEKLESTDRK